MIDVSNYNQELASLKDDIDAKMLRLAEIEKALKDQEKNIEYASEIIRKKLGNIMEEDKFLEFFRKPYVVIHTTKRDKILVAVPKFVRGFQVGWLLKEDPTFYIYELDQYSAWLGDVPQDLLKEIDFKKEIEGHVEGDVIHFEPSQRENIRSKLRDHLREIGENQAVIKTGHVFDVIAEMIKSGCLPFKPRKVTKTRAPRSKIELRPYQKKVIDKFMDTGAVGAFLPTGAGKSMISMHLMDVIPGPKLVVVPTRTLAEQWAFYIDEYLPFAKEEIKIVNYQSFRYAGEEYALTVYDECQRLPADTFSRLAVIKTKYRIGLSASPHREDGRESYIFALTGFPVGLNWREYMDTVGRSYHPISVHVVKSRTQKLSKMLRLVDPGKKTFVFCDSIELGKEAARMLGVPYVYGSTDNRLQEIESNRVLVVSRVMDLGVSVKDLQRIVEIDFLYGSRQQELQRTGRLMHSNEKDLRHDIVMTEQEFQEYGKRLWALREKGFSLRMVES